MLPYPNEDGRDWRYLCSYRTSNWKCHHSRRWATIKIFFFVLISFGNGLSEPLRSGIVTAICIEGSHCTKICLL